MSEIMSIYRIEVPRFSLCVHTGARYPNGHKTFYVIRGEKESYSKHKLNKFYARKRKCEFTDNSVRDWFLGNIELSVLQANEQGSHSIADDLLVYLHEDRKYKAACNTVPPVGRQLAYHPKHKHIGESLGHTMSIKMLEWRKKHSR